MSGKTGIQWTDATLNAIVGCDYVSTGCLHCYAATLHNRRYLAWKRGRWPEAPKQYHLPFKQVQLLPERLQEPFRWRTPRKVFFNSVSDLWHQDVPDWFLCLSFATMALTPQHTYQILTKRPERMRDWLRTVDQEAIQAYAAAILDKLPKRQQAAVRKHVPDDWRWPLPNVWLGVSVEDQRAADERIPLLLQTPAAIRFLSCEPLLGPVNLIGGLDDPDLYGPIWHKRAVQTRTDYGSGTEWDIDLQCGIDWCIIGGESGTHARPMKLVWARSLADQCDLAGVPIFMKQLGTVWACEHSAHDRHGGDMDEWPEDLRVREFPQIGARAEVVAVAR